MNKNRGPSFARLSVSILTGPVPSDGLRFITLLLTTSAGAHIVVATVPARADETKCSGIPLSRSWADRMASLKKSYETSWEAFMRIARIYGFSLVRGIRKGTDRIWRQPAEERGHTFLCDHPVHTMQSVSVPDLMLRRFRRVCDHANENDIY